VPPAHPPTLTGFLLRHADERPDTVFWRHLPGGASPTQEPAALTFGALAVRARQFAHAYREAGARAGDVVLLFLPHHVDATPAFFGAMLAGAVPSFMPCPSPKQHPSVYWPAHRALLQRVGARLLISTREHEAAMRVHGLVGSAMRTVVMDDVGGDHRLLDPVAVDGDAVALLQHSSGTTALKKGVALSHRAILAQVRTYADVLRMGAEDPVVSWLPLYHDMGLIACAVSPLVLGQTVTSLDPFHWAARPRSLFDAIDRYDGHFVWLPNFAFEHLVRAVPAECAADLSRVRGFINCSEPCRSETFRRFRKRFAPLGVREEQLQVCYAMAETVFAVSQTEVGAKTRELKVDTERLQQDGVAVRPDEGRESRRLLSTGRPLAGLEVRILRDGRGVPDGEVGEIALRGAFLFNGYFNDAQTTSERVRDGWYHTRDRAFLEDGQLYVLGRQDDLLIVGGRNLHAHEVEDIVGAVAGVRPGRVVAFGVFDERFASETLVVVAERSGDAGDRADGDLAREIREAVYDRTNIEVSRCLVVEPGWLVKTTSGKVSRDGNKTKYLAADVHDSGPGPGASSGGTMSRLAAIVARQFDLPAGAVHRETVAADVEGWDSLAQGTLMLSVEQAFGVRFGDAEMFAFANVGTIADRVDALKAKGRSGGADRTVYESPAASIVRFGQAGGPGPEIVAFAGRAKKFGKLSLMDFASSFLGTSARDTPKFFVTDRCRDWYTTAFDELVPRINGLSDRPKVLVGNSMGGYGALRFAAAIDQVAGVLAIAPQSLPKQKLVPGHLRQRAARDLTLRADVPYCILFGEFEDEDHKARLGRQLGLLHRIVIVPNCGHSVVQYLNSLGLLPSVLDCCLRPATMADEIQAIVSTIARDPGGAAFRSAGDDD